MRQRQAYYTVFALKDGTIVAALQTRKPHKKSLMRGEEIDEDGIHRWYIVKKDNYVDLPDRSVIIGHVTVAGRLNTRRSIRELLFPKLKQIEQRIAAQQKQLDRIESLLVNGQNLNYCGKRLSI